jgi:hypothetical protein
MRVCGGSGGQLLAVWYLNGQQWDVDDTLHAQLGQVRLAAAVGFGRVGYMHIWCLYQG